MDMVDFHYKKSDTCTRLAWFFNASGTISLFASFVLSKWFAIVALAFFISAVVSGCVSNHHLKMARKYLDNMKSSLNNSWKAWTP